MSNVDFAIRVGGILSILVFIHFAVDFIFQSHAEAMVKHNNPRVRAKHCAIYTLPFIPLLVWFGLPLWQILICSQILFWSHFCEDTYLPVYWWTKYVRRVPSMSWRLYGYGYNSRGVRLEPPKGTDTTTLPDGQFIWRQNVFYDVANDIITIEEGQKKLDQGGFREFVDTALGKILMIAIDQIIHIGFLFPVAWMVARM